MSLLSSSQSPCLETLLILEYTFILTLHARFCWILDILSRLSPIHFFLQSHSCYPCSDPYFSHSPLFQLPIGFPFHLVLYSTAILNLLKYIFDPFHYCTEIFTVSPSLLLILWSRPSSIPHLDYCRRPFIGHFISSYSDSSQVGNM